MEMLLWAETHGKAGVGASTEPAWSKASSLTLRLGFSLHKYSLVHLPSLILHVLFISLTELHKSKRPLPCSSSDKEHCAAGRHIATCFHCSIPGCFPMQPSPCFHLCLGIPEELWRSKPLCEIWLLYRVTCHRGMEVITREFPQMDGYCGAVPGSLVS